MKSKLHYKLNFLFIFLIFESYTSNAQVGTIVDSFSIDIGSPYALGVANDGNNLWISGSPNGFIYKYSKTGQKLDSIPDPAANLFDFAEGIYCDGNNVWSGCYSCDTLYKTEISTKTVTGRYPGILPDDRVSIAYDGHNTLYFPDGSDGMGGFTFDLNTQLFSPWTTTSGNTFTRGLTFIGDSIYGTGARYIPALGALHSVMYSVDAMQGVSTNYELWCVNDNVGGLGMTYDGQYIWQAVYGEAKIYKIQFDWTMQSQDPIDMNTTWNNPVQSELVLSGIKDLKSQLEIFDMTGKKVISVKQISEKSDVSSLKPGCYLIKIIGSKNSEVVYGKIIKE